MRRLTVKAVAAATLTMAAVMSMFAASNTYAESLETCQENASNNRDTCLLQCPPLTMVDPEPYIECSDQCEADESAALASCANLINGAPLPGIIDYNYLVAN